MKTENWIIEGGKLVCVYETYNGKKGRSEFTHTAGGRFLKEGTQRYLSGVSWCNLSKCYTALYNTTQFSAFIKADLTQFSIPNY